METSSANKKRKSLMKPKLFHRIIKLAGSNKKRQFVEIT